MTIVEYQVLLFILKILEREQMHLALHMIFTIFLKF